MLTELGRGRDRAVVGGPFGQRVEGRAGRQRAWQKWQRTALEAAKQSRRARIPVVAELAGTRRGRRPDRRPPALALLLHEDADDRRWPTAWPAAGRAGGRGAAGGRPGGRRWRRDELALFAARGARPVRLGPGGAAHLDRRRGRAGGAVGRAGPLALIAGWPLAWSRHGPPTACSARSSPARSRPTVRAPTTTDVLAFDDVDPKAPTHVLVVPKRHFADIGELAADPQTAARGAGRHRRGGRRARPDRPTGRCSTPAPRPARRVFHVHAHVLAGRTPDLAARAEPGPAGRRPARLERQKRTSAIAGAGKAGSRSTSASRRQIRKAAQRHLSEPITSTRHAATRHDARSWCPATLAMVGLLGPARRAAAS